MSLKNQIQQHLLTAMKAHEDVKVSALRMLKSAVMKFEVAGKEKIEATDDDIIKIIKKEAKQRKDSIEQFKQGGRDDLIGQEQAELEVLETYLPAMLSEDQLREIVKQVVAEVGASSMSDMGRVMGVVMSKVGAEADGSMVKSMVQEALK